MSNAKARKASNLLVLAEMYRSMGRPMPFMPSKHAEGRESPSGAARKHHKKRKAKMRMAKESRKRNRR